MKRYGRPVLPYSNQRQDYSAFPALKHFFKCDEQSGSALACAKTGILFTPYELEFDASTRTVRPNKTYATYTTDGPISGGSWATFESDHYWMHMFVITVREYVEALTVEEKLRVRCRIGPLDNASLLDPSGNGHKWGTSTRGNLHVALTGASGNDGWVVASPVSLDATFYDRTIVVYSKVSPYVDAVTPNKYIEVLDENGVSLGMSSSQASQNGTGAGDISPSPQAGWTGGNFYGSAWFSFADGYPSDLDTAIKWMAASWINGDRAIYPGWKERA